MPDDTGHGRTSARGDGQAPSRHRGRRRIGRSARRDGRDRQTSAQGVFGLPFHRFAIGAHPSELPNLLTTAGRLLAMHPQPGEEVRPGRIYIAPPDRHLLLADRQVLLSVQPREHFTRPAIDPLFRSAARTYESRVVGVLLSGTGCDGSAGLENIRRAGGLVILQDPAQAAFPEMPATALRSGRADFVLPSPAIADLLVRLTAGPSADERGQTMAQAMAEADFEAPWR